jgi:hypothetical protein
MTRSALCRSLSSSSSGEAIALFLLDWTDGVMNEGLSAERPRW